MSEQVGRTDEYGVTNLGGGFEALRHSSTLNGPVEARDDHHDSNDHLALIYETRDEQFDAAIPFIRQGIERGERCVYVADENSREDVLAAMQARGIDVDTALESDTLSVHTKADTYLRTGEFDRDAMVEFWEESLEQATEEDGFAGIRAAAEMTWALEADTDRDRLAEYEAVLNDVYEGEDYAVLCQYNRERFSPAVIYDIVRTHPHLIHDGAVYHNGYYTPPEEFFGPKQPAREVDRMLGTLRERTEVKTELQERKEHFERVFESSHDAIFIIDPEADEFIDVNPAATEMLGYTRDELLSLGPSDIHPDEVDRFRAFVDGVATDGAGWTDELGCHTKNRGRIPAEISASWIEYDYRPVILATVRDISQRKAHERSQWRLYEIAADTDRTVDEKLAAVFELGCDRFDVEFGGLAKVDVEADRFEIETINGDHDHLVPGERYPLSETYCQMATADGGTAAVADPVGAGFEGKLCYDKFGVRTYLGTHLELDGGDDRTLFFLSNEPRDEPFSETERTFHHLMGQWVKYELERKQREDRLSGLNALSRELIGAETATEVSEHVVDAADGALQMPLTAIALYHERDGTLRPAAETDAVAELLEATAPLSIGEGIGWEAFVENEQRRETDPLDDQTTNVRHPITEMVALPLGNHGVLLTATTASDGFSSCGLDLVESVAGNVNAALGRARREQQLQAREATLSEQNEALERLNRVNDIIRRIDQALVQSSTRAEIETVVCEQLAYRGAYELAWIGEHDAVTGEVTPRASAGAEKGYLDQRAALAGDQPTGLTDRAAQTREPQVVNNILADVSDEPWRQAALNRGYHASVALPLVYKDTLYGVLNVYAGQPNAFGDLERAVLLELAETIAYAINAVESKKALVCDEVTELEFTVTDESVDFTALSAQVGCEISLESLVPQSDGRLRAFFAARGVPPVDILEFGPWQAASNVDLVSEGTADGEAGGLFVALLTDDSLCASVVDHGGTPRDVAAVDGTARVVIDLAADAATHEFVEMIATKYPDSELVAQRTRDRPRKTRTELHDALTDDLTERQLEVFQTAYFNGYFDKPRRRTGSEIAASLDITQPTFNHHVRAAQRKLCRRLFEQEMP